MLVCCLGGIMYTVPGHTASPSVVTANCLCLYFASLAVGLLPSTACNTGSGGGGGQRGGGLAAGMLSHVMSLLPRVLFAHTTATISPLLLLFFNHLAERIAECRLNAERGSQSQP